MSSDFEAYEQDFGTITAEVTNKIGRIPKLSGGKRVIFISCESLSGSLAPVSAEKAANGSCRSVISCKNIDNISGQTRFYRVLVI